MSLVAFHYRSYGTFCIYSKRLHNFHGGFTHYRNYRAVFSGLKKLYSLIIDHKAWTLVLLTVVQLFILLTSGGLARSDTTILYQLTTDPYFAKESIYISNYPNNFLFLIYLKIIYKISPENLVFNLSLLNIVFVNSSLMLSYQLVKEYFKEKIANGKLQVQVSHPDKPVSACCN